MRWSMDVHEYVARVVLLSAQRSRCLTKFQIRKLEGVQQEGNPFSSTLNLSATLSGTRIMK